MDRELRVKNGNYELAALVYSYDRPGSGKVQITINKIYDLGDDMKSVYPTFEYESYFSHPDFKSLDEIKAFDKKQLMGQPDFASQLEKDTEYVYEPVLYRYLIKHRDTIGIAEINTNFNENIKEMKFISAVRQKDDFSTTADSFQTHKSILSNFCEEYLNCYGVDLIRVGWD